MYGVLDLLWDLRWLRPHVRPLIWGVIASAAFPSTFSAALKDLLVKGKECSSPQKRNTQSQRRSAWPKLKLEVFSSEEHIMSWTLRPESDKSYWPSSGFSLTTTTTLLSSCPTRKRKTIPQTLRHCCCCRESRNRFTRPFLPFCSEIETFEN